MVLIYLLSGCATDHTQDHGLPNQTGRGAGIGIITGSAFGKITAVYSATSVALVPGMVSGLLFGSVIESNALRSYRLNTMGVSVIPYGDYTTVVLPSDYFFYVDSAELRPDQANTLLEVAALITKNPNNTVSIGAFSDDVGSESHLKELTLQQSHSILSFLWSHGLEKKRLRALGCAKYPAIADRTVLGNGLNRRVEISWRNN